MSDTPSLHAVFRVINGLADTGTLADMKRDELAVLLALLRHADAAGDCFPGGAKLADMAGIVLPTMRRALRRLAERGIVHTLDAGGGSVSARRRLTPPTSSASATGSASDTGPVAPALPDQSRQRYPTGSASATQRNHRRNQLRNHRRNHSPAADAALCEGLYQAYPLKVGKAAALKAIGKALKAISKRPDIADPGAWLLERVKAFAASPAGNAGRYTPHPATWFNEGRYDDDPRTWQLERNTTHGKPNQRTAEQRGEYPEPNLLAALERVTYNGDGNGNGQH